MPEIADQLQAELASIEERISRYESKLGPLREQAHALRVTIEVFSRKNSALLEHSEEGKIDFPLGVVGPPQNGDADLSTKSIAEAIYILLLSAGGPLRLSDIVKGLKERKCTAPAKSIRGILSAERDKRFKSLARGIWTINVRHFTKPEDRPPDD